MYFRKVIGNEQWPQLRGSENIRRGTWVRVRMASGVSPVRVWGKFRTTLSSSMMSVGVSGFLGSSSTWQPIWYLYSPITSGFAVEMDSWSRKLSF